MNIHPTQVIAHRGSSGHAPENTMAAFSLAIEHGADAVELDVRATADGLPVVLHDERLTRTTGDPRPVSEVDSATLPSLDAGSWFAPEFSDERTPPLRDVLELLRGKLQTCIEIKVKGIEKTIVQTIIDADAVRHCMVHSFELETIQRCRELCPELGAAWILQLPDDDPDQEAPILADRALAAGISTISVCVANLTHEIIRDWRRRGLSVFVWTVDSPTALEVILGAGIDGIITNYPDRARSLLEPARKAHAS